MQLQAPHSLAWNLRFPLFPFEWCLVLFPWERQFDFCFLTQSLIILAFSLHFITLILSATLMNLRDVNLSNEVIYIPVELQILDLDDS